MFVGITIGVFDHLNYGHMKLFNRALHIYDVLFIGIHTRESCKKQKSKACHQTTLERMEAVRSFLGDRHHLFLVIHSDPSADLEVCLEEIYTQYPTARVEFFRSSGHRNMDFPGKTFLRDRKISIRLFSYTWGCDPVVRDQRSLSCDGGDPPQEDPPVEWFRTPWGVGATSLDPEEPTSPIVPLRRASIQSNSDTLVELLRYYTDDSDGG